MLNWKKITEAAEEALTLDGALRAEFLASACNDSEQLEAASRLLQRTSPGTGFMRTAMPEPADAVATLDEGRMVGPWRIEALIGRGGMGEVYKAARADGLYEQTVALKLVQGAGAVRASTFETERRRLAMMEHPGIARIVDGGTTDDGRPWMAMEYVDGAPIDAFVTSRQLGLRDRLALFRRVCEAVRHAHNKLVLHRDIKSQNVLVDNRGEPRLIDFGIAADLDDAGDGAGPLTLGWAAPEQLRGEALTAQTDVFALGVLLHVLATGTRPEREPDGGMSIVRDAINDADLAAILGRALATDPGARYASADALAEDVGAWLERRPVAARDGGRLYRLGRLMRRAPVAASLGAAFVVALAGGLAASLTFANEARDEATRARAALERAEWQWERTEANLAAQQAYSDVLQLAFGGEEDAARLSELMMTRWREVFDARESDPATAAATSYAIGRNFYFRGDPVRALEIFDAWMGAGIGSAPLVAMGEEVYGLLLADGGRDAEAEPLLRALVERFSTGFQQSEADLFNYAFKLARITKADEDLERAESLVLKLIENDTKPFELMFHHNQLGFLRMARDDRQGAYDAFVKTVSVIDENPSLAPYGRDIARFNLASQELGFRRDLERTEAIARAILDEDVPLKGESIQQGRAELLLGLVGLERGDAADGLEWLTSASALFEKYGGAGSPWHVKGLGTVAIAQAAAGAAEDARATLAAARASVAGVDAGDARHHSLAMAETHVALTLGDAAAAPADTFADPGFLDAARGDAVLYYLYQRLVEAGAAPPLPARTP